MRTLVGLSVDLTLMVLDHNGDYRPSSVMTFHYYVAADAAFMADLQQNSEQLMGRIYSDHRRVLAEREPDDPNYIAVVGVAPQVITDHSDQPWLRGNRPVWEDSNLIAPGPENYSKVSPEFFGALLSSNL